MKNVRSANRGACELHSAKEKHKFLGVGVACRFSGNKGITDVFEKNNLI